MLKPVLDCIDAAQEKSLENLFALLKFKSIGTDPAYAADCRATAGWLLAYFKSMGLVAEERETTGQPVIVGRWGEGQTNLPHVLFYGHYDVQPVDPLNLWASPPFEPRIGKTTAGHEAIFGRGTSDDKGQLMTFLEAVRAWLQVHGSLPFRLTVLIEGDEEGDSGHIDRFLEQQGKVLGADIARICDTEMWDAKTPAITTSLRGCIAEDVTITGPKMDLHSGYFGGPATNTLKVLSGLIAKLHDKTGRIAIPGFYEGMKPISKQRLSQWKKLGLTARHYLRPVGLAHAAGEQSFSIAEQLWARPTVEVNGFWGGYTAEGRKTVLPSTAQAKFTFRLVEGQKPAKVRAAFRKFMKANLPPYGKISFTSHGGDSSGIAVAEDNPWITLAAAALKDEWSRPTALVGSGVSIPVVESFRKHQKMESLLVGFSRFDDAAHSPNEKYDVECYHRGTRSWARIIGKIAEGNLK
jgi:acetylornithine deacetylase/succinyl-diaminopimelate desuccinylase-like protein